MFSREQVLGAIGHASGLVVLDITGRVELWSDGAARLFGWTAADCVGRRWQELGTVVDSVRESHQQSLLAEVATGATREVEWTARRPDGQAIRVHTALGPVFDAEGNVVGAVGVCFDQSGREGFEQALVRAALHDRLTRLPGRSLFVHEVGLALADRRTANRVAVLFVDLDRFKRVNDEHGHAAGDAVLVTIADRLAAAVRDGDVVARLGGDEFAVLVRLGSSTDHVIDLAERIGATLAQPIEITGVAVEVGASIGVAIAGPDDQAEDVLARADAAMYRAKRSEPQGRAAGFSASDRG